MATVKKIWFTAMLSAAVGCSPQYSNSSQNAAPGLPSSLGDIELVEVPLPGRPGETIKAFPSKDAFESAMNPEETTAIYLNYIQPECSSEVLNLVPTPDGTPSSRLDCYAGFYVRDESTSLSLAGESLPADFVRLTDELKNSVYPNVQFDFTVASPDSSTFPSSKTSGFVGMSYSYDLAHLGQHADVSLQITPEPGSGIPVITKSDNPLFVGCGPELDGNNTCNDVIAGEIPSPNDSGTEGTLPPEDKTCSPGDSLLGVVSFVTEDVIDPDPDGPDEGGPDPSHDFLTTSISHAESESATCSDDPSGHSKAVFSFSSVIRNPFNETPSKWNSFFVTVGASYNNVSWFPNIAPSAIPGQSGRGIDNEANFSSRSTDPNAEVAVSTEISFNVSISCESNDDIVLPIRYRVGYNGNVSHKISTVTFRTILCRE